MVNIYVSSFIGHMLWRTNAVLMLHRLAYLENKQNDIQC